MQRPTPLDRTFVIELFAGPGGMSEGLKLAGIDPGMTIGIEKDKDACDTAEKAGHPRLHADITTLDPSTVARQFGYPAGMHGSPPCPGFSQAGKGLGRKDTDAILEAIRRIGYGQDPVIALAWLRSVAKHPDSALCIEPLHWALALEPEWLSLEQVPAVLPLWEAVAEVLRVRGYSVWTGYMHAEQYGVPQTRKRAILLASRFRTVTAPVPTHSKFHVRTPERLDEGVEKWVSMAEALGWGMIRRPYPTVAAGTKAGGADPQMLGGSGARAIVARAREAGAGHWIERHVGFPRRYDGGAGGPIEIGGELYRARDLRSEHEPSFTISERARSWHVYEIDPDEVARITEERLNNQSGSDFDTTWPMKRPAAVVAGREINTAPGANGNRFNGSKKSRNDGVRITVDEASTLQSFPENYSWQGSRTSQFQQIGNAVPPLLGYAMIRHLTA